MQAPHPLLRPPDLDLRQAAVHLRRAAAPILLTALLCAGGAYLASRRHAPEFQAVSSVLAVQDASQNSLINNTLVTAPPLPQGAVDQAIHSPSVVNDIVRLLKKSSLSAERQQRISDTLNLELRTQVFRRIDVTDRLDNQQRGVYEVQATGGTPEEAQALTDAAVSALLRWDQERAQSGVQRAQKSLQLQATALRKQANAAAAGSVERSALTTSLGQLNQNLAQLQVFEQAATGPLTLVASANRPLRPVRPEPLRNAVIAALFGLLGASGVALLLAAIQRRVTSREDLEAYPGQVLGELPRLTPRELGAGYLNAQRAGHGQEAASYLRVALQAMTAEQPGDKRYVIVSSSTPGEGKSSVTASLAEAFASTDLRVLIIDADLHRPTQHLLWGVPITGDGGTWTVTGGASSGQGPTPVAENVDLIPAGDLGSKTSVLNRTTFGSNLEQWSAAYDVILIDTPPLLSVSDALTVSKRHGGLLFVVEAGRAQDREIRRALHMLGVAGVPLLGYVLNKTTPQGSGDRTYTYDRRPVTDGAAAARMSVTPPARQGDSSDGGTGGLKAGNPSKT